MLAAAYFFFPTAWTVSKDLGEEKDTQYGRPFLPSPVEKERDFEQTNRPVLGLPSLRYF